VTEFDHALRDIEEAATGYEPGDINLGFVARKALRAARDDGWAQGYRDGRDDMARAQLDARIHARTQAAVARAQEANPS